MIELVIYARRACHLCETMESIVAREIRRRDARLSVVDVDSAPDLVRAFGERVPVLFVEGKKFAEFRVDPGRLRERLDERRRGVRRREV